MAKKWYSVLVKENLYGIGSQTLAIISGMVFAVIFPRLLGPTLFSYFSLVFALANFSLFFCEFGLGVALMKLMPASIVRKEAPAYYRFFSKLKYALTAASSVLVFLLSDLIASILFKQPDLGSGIRISSIFLFSYALYGFYEILFAAVKKNKFAFYINMVFQSCRIALPLTLYYVYRTYTSVLLGLGLAALAGLVAGLLLKSRLKHLLSHASKATIDYPTFRKYFVYGTIGYLGTVLVQWMDSLVVGVFINPAEVGFYRIGVMWMSVVWLFIPFSSRVLYTLYSEKTETRENDKVNTVYSYSLRYSLVIGLLIIVGVLLTSDYFITLVYGNAYAAAAPVLFIMSLLAVESSLNAINVPLLQGVGKIDVQTKYAILVGLLTLVGSIYASKYGINGVAFAVTLIRVVSILALTLYVLRHLKFRLKRGVYLKPLSSAALTLILLAPFKSMVHSLPSGLFYGFAVVAVYAVVSVAFKAVSLEEVRKIVSAVISR